MVGVPATNFPTPRELSLDEIGSSCRRGSLAALVWISTLLIPISAQAAKWINCPVPPFPTYPSEIGATNAPFVHPGHELTIVLNDAEVAATGGFSESSQGNQVSIAFHSPLGMEIPLDAIPSDALSAAALSFVFPSTSQAGPVDVRIHRGDQLVAHISWQDLVALPPTNDVTSLLTGGSDDRTSLAAVGADGDVWLPVHFQGEPMAMPSCPGDFIFPVSVQLGGATLAFGGDALREPLRQLHGLGVYFGDVRVNDYTLYGVLFMDKVRLVHVADTLGVSVCKMNDATDLVLRLKGAQSWASGQNSPFAPAVATCSPVPLVLNAARKPPGRDLTQVVDSFDNSCSSSLQSLLAKPPQ